jgi:hypothetical protein
MNKINNIPVLISCYSNTNTESSILSMNVEQLYNYGHPICITSHKLINRDLEDKIDYFIYTNENYELPKNFDKNYFYFMETGNFRYQTNFNGGIGGYSYAIVLNLINGLNLLKSKGFKFFIFSESDTVIDYPSYNRIVEYLTKFNFNYHNSWFMVENVGTVLVSSSLFMGNIDFFISKLVVFDTMEKYVSYCDINNIGYGLEIFLSTIIVRDNDKCLLNNNKISEIVTNSFLGCLSGGQMNIKDFKTYEFWLDIVRSEDSNSIFLVISGSRYSDNLTAELYYDNILKSSSEKVIGDFYLYDIISDFNFSEISYVVKQNGNTIKKVSRSKDEIFNNVMSYAKIF